ncbi:MAG TPA: hypothetical protein VKG44_00155 [Candidatus Baltobacteraceae bacterium]|nr:hypothetical protein [Candidatus Baltobacteraceae bacterium]
MKFFLGTWNCESKSARRPTAAKSTVTSTMDPTGYWMTSVTKSPAVPWYQHDATSWDYVTYDSTTKRWIDMSYDDTGGYDFSQSEGWKGDTMIWKEVTYSKGADLASSADNTVTKVSDKLQKFESSFTTTAGKTVGVTGSCTKV